MTKPWEQYDFWDFDDPSKKPKADPTAPACLRRLGLGRHAGEQEIRAAFRQLAKKAHPDVGGTAAEFVALRRAYEDSLYFARTGHDRSGRGDSAPGDEYEDDGLYRTAPVDPDIEWDPEADDAQWRGWTQDVPPLDPKIWDTTPEDKRRQTIEGAILIGIGLLLAVLSIVLY